MLGEALSPGQGTGLPVPVGRPWSQEVDGGYPATLHRELDLAVAGSVVARAYEDAGFEVMRRGIRNAVELSRDISRLLAECPTLQSETRQLLETYLMIVKAMTIKVGCPR